MRAITLLLASALAAGCSTPKLKPWSSCVPEANLSDGFTLTDDATGAAFGPFPMTNGTSVAVASKSLVLTLSNSRIAEFERKLKAVSMPEVNFRNAALADVFEFFSLGSLPFADDENEPRITFILMGKGTGSRTVSLLMRNTNLFDAFTVVCDMLALTYKLDPRGVVFIMPKEGTYVTFHDEARGPPYSSPAPVDPF